MKKGYAVVLVFIAIFIGSIFLKSPKSADIFTNKDFVDELMEYIFEMRIENAYIVYSQAVLESGNFSSDIFKENHNLFGMKMPERRATTAIGVNRGHAVYKNWRESVIDYALMQAAYYRGLSEKEYLDKICSVYAEDSMYRKRIVKMMKND